MWRNDTDRETLIIEEKPSSIATSFRTDLTTTAPVSNPGLRDED